jgi:hypothetical protein
VSTTHKAVLNAVLTLTRNNDTNFAGGGANVSRVGNTVTLTDGTTPNVTEDAVTKVTLSGGNFTLDLTSIAGEDGVSSVSLSGKKVRVMVLVGDPNNGHDINVGKGGINGYHGFDGATAFSTVIRKGGGIVVHYDGGNGAAVDDAAHKTLDFSGTGSDVVYVGIAAGS